MQPTLLHVYRNTPIGRETWLQSLHFCAALKARAHVFFPPDRKFLMYFEHDAVQIDLDASYLRNRDTAERHCLALARGMGLEPVLEDPAGFTASNLPDVSTRFDYMCCPRVMSAGTAKIGPVRIGPKVRRIVSVAPFPVLLTGGVFKPWHSIAVLFGGSDTAVAALRLGFAIARKSGLPLDVFTQAKGHDKAYYEDILQQRGLLADVHGVVREWFFFQQGELEDNFMAMPHDALTILGAFGHGLIREVVFGSTMEMVLSELPNNLLVVGPRYASRAPSIDGMSTVAVT